MGGSSEVNPSLWLGTDEPRPTYPRLTEDIETDIVVIGAGIFGLTTAALLKQLGARVVVLERDLVGTGVTGFSTAKVTSLHGLIYADVESRFDAETARIYGEANEAGVQMLADLASELSIECDVRRLPAYTYAEKRDKLSDVEEEAAAAQRAGLPASFVTDTGLPYEVAGAVRFDNQLQVHPRKYCDGLAAFVGDVYERTQAVDIDRGDPCVVSTETGKVRAGHVVVATQLPFSDEGMYFAKAHPYRSYATAAEYENPPEGMYLSADSPTRTVRPHFMSDGPTWIIIGGESHKVGDDPKTDERYRIIESWAMDRFGVSPTYRWSAHDYIPVDGLPYIGRMRSNSDKVYVATGFAKWGFSTGTFGAMIVRDLIDGKENAWFETFDANRTDIRRSAKTFTKENIEVAKRFIGDRFGDSKRPSIDELSPGEGDLVESGGDIVAAFKDDDGTIYQLSPVCTHLGCRVSFNPAERSWDCPCHGSRFTVQGKVLQGPATEDLADKSRQGGARDEA